MRRSRNGITVCNQPLPDPLRRVPPLARPLPSVAPGTRVGQRPPDRPAAVVEGTGQLPDAEALTEVRALDTDQTERKAGHVIVLTLGGSIFHGTAAAISWASAWNGNSGLVLVP